jgi:cellulose synthase/poly-beta-1,6-N-acetylglucosamine synthase-like glycosyltransferase
LKLLVFIPSYNDTETALQLSGKFLANHNVSKVLIVDDSDDQHCQEIVRKIKHERIEVVSRVRSGKWSAWRLALHRAKEYEGLIEVDSDIEIRNPERVVSSLINHDVVTVYQEIILPQQAFGRAIGEAYQKMHEDLKQLGKFNMGGQVIALSNRAVSALLDHGLFEEPVVADDHVVALASWVLGLNCATIDCGLQIRLPATFKEWISYRSRHRGAIKWAQNYVALKTGKPEEAKQASRSDYNVTLRYFVRSLVTSLRFRGLALFILLSIASFLPIENQTKWSRISSEKRQEKG